MALLITITDAGRAEIINADNTGTGPVVITEIGFGTGQYAPSKAQTALTAEVKRVGSIAGQAVAADTIHVIAKDEGSDAYNVGEFGLYSASGTLVAVYSQVAGAGWIIQKAGASTLLLAVDIILESLDAASLSFGDVTFLNPPATTDTPGVVQLEDSLISPSTSKALTAAQGKKLQDEKAPLASPALTGTPTAPTAAAGANTTQLATTAFVAAVKSLLDAAIVLKAPLASPALTGTPTAPTAAQATNNTQLATTAFVKAAIAALIDSSPGALDTLNELAAALGDDPNFATTMTNALAGKQPLAARLTAFVANNGFGLGESGGAKVRQTDLDAITTAGFHVVGAGAVGLPPGQGSGYLWHQDWDASTTYRRQLYFAVSSTRIFIRVMSLGVWGDWDEIGRLASPALTGTPTAPTAVAGTSTTQLATTEFVQSAVGVGVVAPFARSTAPSGWLKANGATISRSTYAALFAAIGTTFGAGDGSTTFQLPDLRGEFLRGWDDGRGVDPGRQLGSAQKGSIYGIDTGTTASPSPASYGVRSNIETNPTGNAAQARIDVGADEDLDASAYPQVAITGVPSTVTNTDLSAGAVAGVAGVARPRNIALLACIKY
ncbi:tail fiber protein [Pseudomonas sp. SA3-5]|uniref:Tail fiber protein n=1 Tax=Pseudomonas aestuarii TaxID=3018340 RepID=A0ABT4XE68_9PSED|nr:tail fiber protein [Pseudomonas aestuarii]MDA7086509.1 tail fiber protein [Pseudomonas aestuarii]